MIKGATIPSSIVVIVLLLSLSPLTRAEPIPSHPEKHFALSFETSTFKSLDDSNQDASARFKEFGFQTIYMASESQYKNSRRGWFLGTTYSYKRYVFKNLASRNRDLHRLLFPFYFFNHNDSQSWALDLIPGLATSSNTLRNPVNRLEKEDLQLSGGILYRRHIGSSTSLLFGLRNDYVFGDPRLYATAGIDWRPNPNTRILITWPESGLQTRLSQGFSLLSSLRPIGNRWHIHADSFVAEFDMDIEGWRWEIGLEWQLSQHFKSHFLLGYEFSRHIQMESDLHQPLSSEIEDTLTSRFVMSMQFD